MTISNIYLYKKYDTLVPYDCAFGKCASSNCLWGNGFKSGNFKKKVWLLLTSSEGCWFSLKAETHMWSVKPSVHPVSAHWHEVTLPKGFTYLLFSLPGLHGWGSGPADTPTSQNPALIGLPLLTCKWEGPVLPFPWCWGAELVFRKWKPLENCTSSKTNRSIAYVSAFARS